MRENKKNKGEKETKYQNGKRERRGTLFKCLVVLRDGEKSAKSE